MFVGTPKERLIGAMHFCAWFAMGAFVASTLEYHLNVVSWTEQTTALAGGIVASAAAFVSKSV
jgi:hypothetical protein